jgi:hypothetical protein
LNQLCTPRVQSTVSSLPLPATHPPIIISIPRLLLHKFDCILNTIHPKNMKGLEHHQSTTHLHARLDLRAVVPQLHVREQAPQLQALVAAATAAAACARAACALVRSLRAEGPGALVAGGSDSSRHIDSSRLVRTG